MTSSHLHSLLSVSASLHDFMIACNYETILLTSSNKRSRYMTVLYLASDLEETCIGGRTVLLLFVVQAVPHDRFLSAKSGSIKPASPVTKMQQMRYTERLIL